MNNLVSAGLASRVSLRTAATWPVFRQPPLHAGRADFIKVRLYRAGDVRFLAGPFQFRQVKHSASHLTLRVRYLTFMGRSWLIIDIVVLLTIIFPQSPSILPPFFLTKLDIFLSESDGFLDLQSISSANTPLAVWSFHMEYWRVCATRRYYRCLFF